MAPAAAGAATDASVSGRELIWGLGGIDILPPGGCNIAHESSPSPLFEAEAAFEADADEASGGMPGDVSSPRSSSSRPPRDVLEPGSKPKFASGLDSSSGPLPERRGRCEGGGGGTLRLALGLLPGTGGKPPSGACNPIRVLFVSRIGLPSGV
jgi:hypothetical protein